MTHIFLYSQVFHDVAYKAKDRNDLVAGIDEFLDQVTVLPPGEWDPSIRIEPPKNVPSQVKLNVAFTTACFVLVLLSNDRQVTDSDLNNAGKAEDPPSSQRSHRSGRVRSTRRARRP